MEVTFEVLKWITLCLSVFFAPVMVWTAAATLRGFGRVKEPVQKGGENNRFAVVVCARNEEGVIGNLLDSLKKQDYTGEWHVFVVADNCTDDTAAIAGEYGATVFQRFNMEKRGKGYALEFGLERVARDYEDRFDAVCVFDADNLASPGFIREMNAALNSGAQAAYGYRDTKNMRDTWVTEVYGLYWLMLTRFFHCPRYAMGMSAIVGGTGFAFLLSALEGKNWRTYSLTEDIEFSIQQILKGHRIAPVRRAVFYDEQPVDFGASVRQRQRWMTGHIQCLPVYFRQALKEMCRGKRCGLDVMCYLFFIPMTAMTVPMNILSASVILLSPVLRPYALPLILGGVAAAYGFAAFIAFMTLRLEKRTVKGMGRAIALYPIFMLTMLFIALAALVRPRTEWAPIAHSGAQKIEDMEKEIPPAA